MGGSGVTLDKVEIQISASAGKANENISQLANTLQSLKASVKGGSGNLAKLAESLKQLKSATNGLEAVSKNLGATTKITNALSKFSAIPSSTGLTKLVKDIDKIPAAFSKFDSKTISNITRVSNELSQALTPLSDKLDKIARGFSSISGLASRYGKSIGNAGRGTKQTFDMTRLLTNNLSSLKDRLGSVWKISDNLIKRLGKGLSSTTSKIKQIGLALLGTRSIFTLTRKAVSEYMQMDAELTWQMTNNWRALGAQLAPVIEYAMYLFKQFIRVIYSVVLALTGIDLIARANEKAMKGWGKAAKDTLGNLQKFDDLNVVEFPKGSGGDDNSLIELDTIDLTPIQKIIEWVRRLRDEIKEAWNTGQWAGVGQVFADGMNAAMEALDFNVLEKKLKSVAEKFGDFLKAAVNRFNWKLFGVRLSQGLAIIPRAIANFFEEIPWIDLGKGLNDALLTFSPRKMLDAIGDVFANLIGGIQNAFLEIDASRLAFLIQDTITGVLKNIHKLFDRIKWGELGKKIHDTIVNINWGEIWSSVVDAAQSAFQGLTDFISNLTGLDSGTIETIAKAFVTIGEAFVAYKIVSGISTFADKLLMLGTSPVGVIALGLVFVFQVIKDIVDLIKDPKSTENWEKLSKTLLVFGTIAGALLLAYVAMNKLGKGTKEVASVAKGAKGALDITSLFGDLGKAAVLISILGGVALVIKELSTLLTTMKDTGLGVDAIFGALAAVFVTVVGLMGAVAILGPAMTAGLVPFSILMLEIAGILGVMALTIPVILDAAADFIERTAPKLNEVLTTIGDNISKIIHAIGDVLPPIVREIGNIFKTVFDGIAKVISTVGDVIVKIMDTANRNITNTLGTIIWFIRELGPAIETFVNSAIRSVTRLIQFVLYGVEYMINSIIVDGMNAIIRKLNKLPVVNFDFISDVKLRPFSPPALEIGTNEIEYEGLYHLHPGEAVVPKKYNPALGGGTNEDTNRRLDTLIGILNELDLTTVVNIGNDQLYKQQKKYNDRKVNKYGTSAVE